MNSGSRSILKGSARFFSAIAASNYLFIVLVGLFCFFPVYSTFFSLKYDNIAFDLPMHSFMGGQVRSGEVPVWFNTWNMGFPMQSVFCWSVFSTIFLSFAGINGPDPYILHLELVFFILLAGVSFYKLLKNFGTKDTQLACFLACSYMLSGFTFGSSQWMFYLSGMAIMPLCIYLLLQLLATRKLKYVLLFPVSYLLLFTNTHVFISITGTYILGGIYLFHLVSAFRKKEGAAFQFSKNWMIPVLSGLILVAFCLPPLYYSLELLPYLQRSLPIDTDERLFHSNFMHPGGLITLLLPQAAIKWQIDNTEGLMQSVYMGILVPLLAFLSVRRMMASPKITNIILLSTSLFFLLLSFGHFLPLRGLINFLPGFSYFRHPGLFRLFFIGFLLLFIARTQNKSLEDIFYGKHERKFFLGYLVFVLFVIFAGLIIGAGALPGFWKGSVADSIKFIDSRNLLFFSCLVQLFILGVLGFDFLKKSKFLVPILYFDLVLNGLICLPFHTISSYSMGDLYTIFTPIPGNPIQVESPSQVKCNFVDGRGTIWEHENTVQKKISTEVDPYNPLVGAKMNDFLQDTVERKKIENQPLLFFNGLSPEVNQTVFQVTEQRPTAVSANIHLEANGTVSLQQMAFPGWKWYLNGLEIPVEKSPVLPMVSAKMVVKEGDTLRVVYEKPTLIFWSVLLNALVYITLWVSLLYKLRYKLMPFMR